VICYAIGVIGVAAAVGIVTTLTKGYSGVTILAISLLFVGMVALYLFSILVVSRTTVTHYAGTLLIWSVVLLLIVFVIFTTTTVPINWPCNWAKILSLQGSCDFAAGPVLSPLPPASTESAKELLPSPRDEPYSYIGAIISP
jgi:hypothetical protein